MERVESYVVPAEGLDAWLTPDATQPIAARLDPGLAVDVTERWGDWGHIVCSNGWTAWVDVRQLVGAATPAAARASSPRRTGIVLAGAALVVVSSVLPWVTAGGTSESAWDLPIATLFARSPNDSGVKLGLLSLLALALLLPLATRRPLPFLVLAIVTIAPVAAAGDVLGRAVNTDGVSPGIGIYLTVLGVALISIPVILAGRHRSTST